MNWDKVYLVLLGVVLVFASVGAHAKAYEDVVVPVLDNWHLACRYLSTGLAVLGGVVLALALADE